MYYTCNCATHHVHACRYFGSLLFAQILTRSLELVPKAILPKIYFFMESFLTWADPKTLHSHEAANGYIWSTVRPHINLVYFPINTHKHSNAVNVDIMETDEITIRAPLQECVRQLMHELTTETIHMQCIEMGVVSLQNMVKGEAVRQVLRDEGLIDFVVCMPWFLPAASRAQLRARALVSELSRCMKLQPPSLVNITRAKLAATKFGLDRILKTNSIQDLVHC